MMPYDTYRLYQVERAKIPGEIQRADEQAARLASAVSWLFRAVLRPTRAARRPYPATVHDGASRLAEPAACRGTMAGVMESS
jgi:hypothetical protein